MFAVIVAGPDKDWFLTCDNSGQIRVSPDKQEMVGGIEKVYNAKHSLSYEASMSACIHNLQFQPKVIEIPDTVEELIPLLESEKLFTISSIAGRYYGVKLKEDVAKKLIEVAASPALIGSTEVKVGI